MILCSPRTSDCPCPLSSCITSYLPPLYPKPHLPRLNLPPPSWILGLLHSPSQNKTSSTPDFPASGLYFIALWKSFKMKIRSKTDLHWLDVIYWCWFSPVWICFILLYNCRCILVYNYQDFGIQHICDNALMCCVMCHMQLKCQIFLPCVREEGKAVDNLQRCWLCKLLNVNRKKMRFVDV